RDHPDRRGSRRRRRTGCRGNRCVSDPGAGWSGADDDRVPPRQHPAGREVPTWRTCLPPRVSYTAPRCNRGGGSVPGPSHVLEREGLRVHRARGWGGRLRPLLGDHDGRVQVADRGSEGRVRGRARPQGRTGRERAGDLGFPFGTEECGPPKGGPLFWEDVERMAITRGQVLHVAKLAELDLTEEEVARLQEQLSAILQAVGEVSD